MRVIAVMVAVSVALAAAAPAPGPGPAPAPGPAPGPAPAPGPEPSADDRPEVIEIIAPAASAQETLATLNLGAPGADLGDRNKRTIGILRQLFPTLTQIIEQKVQQLTSAVLQTFGPVVLRAFLGRGAGGGGAAGTGGGTVELDDDDEEETATAPAPARRRRGAAEGNQLLSGAESQQAEVRVAFGDQQDQQAAASDDQQTNSASIDEITLDDADDSEENRNKRFLSFGGGAGGSGGGSGNFLFDIVRSGGAAAARAAAGAWSVLAGAGRGGLSLDLSASHQGQLVAGSSSGGAEVAAEGEEGAAKGDGLTEGVPGPVTRLFIIANRGIANLIQDLILRLAQTSERIVNFKARLITSII